MEYALDMRLPRTEADREASWDSAVRRDHFRLDIALMLMQRDLNYREAFARFAWSDSSPQGPFDFLMWTELCVRTRDLITVAHAIHYLQTCVGGVLYDADEEVPLAMLDRRAEMSKV